MPVHSAPASHGGAFLAGDALGSAESDTVAKGPLGATCPAPTQVGAPSLFILEMFVCLSHHSAR